MKNELKNLIEKINYNKEEEETDMIVYIYNISTPYLKNYTKIGVASYSDMYYQLEENNTANMYSTLYEYLEEQEKEQEELTEEDYKNILLRYERHGINEIHFLSKDNLILVEEAVEDFKNGYLEENEFLEKINDSVEELNEVNNKIALEIKAILTEILNIENKKIKIKDLKDGEYYFKTHNEIFYIEILEANKEEETEFEFTVFEIPEGDNNGDSHLFQIIKNDKIYLVDKDFKDWYLRKADVVFEGNEEIEIIEPDFMDYYEYLKEYEEEEEEEEEE